MAPHNVTHVSHDIDSPNHVVLGRQPAGSVIGQHYVCKAKCRYDKNVNLWVAKEPKQVLKQYGVATVRKVKERSLSVPVQQHHYNSCTKDGGNYSKHAERQEQGYGDEG